MDYEYQQKAREPIQALRQALAQDALRKLAEIDHELGLYEDGPAVKSYCGGKPNHCTPVDAVNMSQDRVDETEKREHKREWVGLTRRELDIATLGLEDLGDCYIAIEAKLKEKNT